MFFYKCLQSLILKQKRTVQSIAKFKFMTFPKFSHYNSIGSKQSRSRFWKNLGIISGAGVGACLVFHRNEVAGKEPDSSFPKNGISSNDYESVISKARELLCRIKDEIGAPGLVVGVSIDGETIWEEGFGYSDVENRVLCTPNTVMRIASISKSITMTAVAKLWECGKLDLDKPVQYYVPEFPQKSFDGIPVEITCRYLVSHLSGIRHYDKKEPESSSKNNDKTTHKGRSLSITSSLEKKDPQNEKGVKEFENKEYYIKDYYSDVRSALDLFKDDPLVSKPGTKFHYSTHGWTLISAIVEKASGEPFTTHMTKLFKTLGMKHTYFDVNESLIYHRSRCYSKDKHGRIVNSPYVDNSYKWAGGGFLSTVGDLLKFANSMLYSLQYNQSVCGKTVPKMDKVKAHNSSISNTKNNKEKQAIQNEIKSHGGYLSSETVKSIWTPVTNRKDKDSMYAMGWVVVPEKKECEYCDVQRFVASHSGGAIGASSALLILPKQCSADKKCLECQWSSPPKGVMVALMTNLQEIALSKVALEIAIMFDSVSSVSRS